MSREKDTIEVDRKFNNLVLLFAFVGFWFLTIMLARLVVWLIQNIEITFKQ
jgi:hypothetical protein